MIGVFTLIFYIVSLILGGFTISTTWNWFVVPIFEAQELTLLMGLRLSLVVSSFIGYRIANRPDSISEKIWPLTMVMGQIMHYAIILGFGWIIRMIMNGQ